MLIIKIASEYETSFTIQNIVFLALCLRILQVSELFRPVKFSVGLLFSLQCWKSGKE